MQYAQLEATTFSALDPPAPAYQLPAEGDHYSYDGSSGSTTSPSRPTSPGSRTWKRGPDVRGLRPLGEHDHGAGARRTRSTRCSRSGPAPGYGPVKSIDRVEAFDTLITEELIEFHGAEGNWWADGRAPRRDLEVGDPVAGSTDGFDVQRSRAVPDGRLGEIAGVDRLGPGQAPRSRPSPTGSCWWSPPWTGR